MWTQISEMKTKLLFGILIIGFILRVGYVLTVEDKIFWIDGVEYYSLSQNIVAGQGYVTSEGVPTAYRPVGYPLLLSFLFILGGNGLLWVRLAQAVISSATILLVFLLAKKLMGNSSALIAALISAIYPYFIFLPSAILPTCWFSFLIVAGIYLLIQNNSKHEMTRTIASGIVFGLATLTRPSAAILVIAIIGWLLMTNLSAPKKALLRVVTFGVCVSMVVLPWMMRNKSAIGKPVIATNGGRNFWLGNNQRATATTGNNVALPKELDERLAAVTSELQTIYRCASFAIFEIERCKGFKFLAALSYSNQRLPGC